MRCRADDAALRLYRWMLRAYPRGFRQQYAGAMEEAFLADLSAGRRGRVRFWAAILRDTFASAAGERLRGSALRVGGPNLPSPPRKGLADMFIELLQDLRFAFRTLRRSPVFAAVAFAVLALGIGATAVVFSLVNALFLTPPPHVADPASLLRVSRYTEEGIATYMDYNDWRYLDEHAETLAGIAAFDPGGTAVTVGRGGARYPARAGMVTGNYFDLLGVPMALGRGFAPEEDAAPNQAAVVVLADAFWRNALGGDAGIVGETLLLNGNPFTVVGVAARGFRGTGPLDSPVDLWAPTMMAPMLFGAEPAGWVERQEGRSIHWLQAVGRLAPGASVQQAQAELDALNGTLQEDFGEWNDGLTTRASRSFMFEPGSREELLGMTNLLAAVVVMVLLIVCANVAILQLARATSRQREIGIRAALGAGRGRVVRQLMTESLVLSAAGTAGGLLLASALTGFVSSLIPMQFAVEVRPDLTVLGFASALAVAAALIFGLAPALVTARVDLTATMQSRAVLGGRSWLRSGLVVFQVAASVILVTAAALFARSLMRAESIDPGFRTEGVAMVMVALSSHGYDQEAASRLYGELIPRLEALPGVEHASVASRTPYAGSWRSTFDPDGEEGPAEEIQANMNIVGPGYFDALGIRLVAGRDFGAEDVAGSESVLVINEVLAERLWPGESPIGKVVPALRDDAIDRVIGVVENVDYDELGQEPPPIFYASAFQNRMGYATFVASTRGSAAALGPEMQRAILEVDPDLSFPRVTTIEAAVADEMGTYALGTRAVGSFGLLAATLAAVGLYGVLSFLVAARTREIGIRMALGSTRRGVLGTVLGNGVRLAAVGVVCGVGAALLATRWLAGMLYGISPYDPVSFVGVPLLLLAIAVVASLVPARRAARVDPLEALRAE